MHNFHPGAKCAHEHGFNKTSILSVVFVDEKAMLSFTWSKIPTRIKRPCKCDPLKPHFNIVKLTAVLIFLSKA